MDALKEYDSDSLESTENDKNELSDGNEAAFDQEQYYAKTQSGESSTDFFGISKDSDKQNYYKDKAFIPVIKSVQVGNEEISVEIPTTSFWNKFPIDDLQKLQQPDKSHVRKRPFEQSDDRKRAGSFGQSEMTSSLNTYINVDHVKKRNSELRQFPINKTGTTNELNSNDNLVLTQRKLFFVHPKIAPLMYLKDRQCRVPIKQEWSHHGHAGAVNRLKWNMPAYSHLLASCSMDSTVKIWNIWSLLDPCVQALRVHTKAVKDVEWSDNGKQLLSCGYDRSAVVTDIETGVPVCRLEHTCYVMCARYHKGNSHVCVTGGLNQILVWDTRTTLSSPQQTFSYKDTFGQVQDLVFTRDGFTLFSCSDMVSRDSADRNIMAWDFKTGITLSNQIYQLQGYGIGFDASPDGKQIYSGSSDGKLYCYDNHSGKLRCAFNTGLDVTLDVACHPLVSSNVAIAGWDGTIQVWK